MRQYSALTWTFFALGIGLVAYAWLTPPQPYTEARTIGTRVSEFKELMRRFQEIARDKNASYAFAVLLRAKLAPNTDLHLLGHAIGDVMYEQKGVDGIAECTQELRNACSHAVVIGALNEFGTEALPMIRDACKKAPGGAGAYTMCFHGLGHGVFAYYSYSLPETVEFCRSTGTAEYENEEFSQCVSGAVMELMGGGGHDREAWLQAREKYLDPTQPLRPCDTALIPEETKALCFIYLTPRFFELAGANLGRPDPALFPKAFSFCEAIPASDMLLRDACYGGFGKEFIVLAGERDIRNVARYTDTAFQKTLSWCALAGSQEGEDACIGDAVASVFWGGENNPDGAFRFCALVSTEKSSACYGRLASDIRAYVEETERQNTLCARIPEALRGTCEASI